ncbi:probable pectinesterase 8 isoform X2 [Glycine max]|uniref:probable pectinesterase 8 isoform X2 n=1 Tax=Glycine max TaxID=3847 RepID=UPI001B355558|nr:probable pectinesterase 8 isoform X2 [Glycine max]
MYLGWYLLTFFFFLTSVKIVLVHANHNHHHHHHHEQRNNKQIANKTSHSSSGTIIVDLSGNGDFSTIQSAIDSISSDNKNWVYIYVKAGTYREKVKISFDKPFIVLEGEGQKNTFVEWDDHDSSAESPTFTTMADNVVVKSISFRTLCGMNKEDITSSLVQFKVLWILSSALPNLYMRTVPYPLLMLILVLALLVLSPHKGEQIQTIQMGLFLSNAISLEMVQLTWEDHGEVMLELFSIILKCPTLYNH